jgi:hypothetical protein
MMANMEITMSKAGDTLTKERELGPMLEIGVEWQISSRCA